MDSSKATHSFVDVEIFLSTRALLFSNSIENRQPNSENLSNIFIYTPQAVPQVMMIDMQNYANLLVYSLFRRKGRFLTTSASNAPRLKC